MSIRKKALHKLISLAAACVVAVGTASFTAAAAGKSGAEVSYEPARIVRDEFGEFIYIDAPCPEEFSGDCLLATKRKLADPAGDDFLERCKGQQWGYNHLTDYPTLVKYGFSTTPQTIYNNLYNACVQLWNNPDTFEAVTVANTSRKAIFTTEAINELSGRRLAAATSEEVDEIMHEVNRIYFMFRHDNPVFYYLGISVLGWSDGKISVVITDDAYLNGDTRSMLQSRIKSYVKSTDQLVKDDYTRTDYQNAFELYKSVMNRMKYAYDENGVVSNKATAYNVIGGIVGENNADEGEAKRMGVCEGYSRIFSLLLNYHGIDNIYVTGTGHGEEGWEGHAWVMLKLDDGKYYFADPTWGDRGSSNENSKEYFAKGTTAFGTDHILDTYAAHQEDPDDNDYLFAVPEVPADDFVYPADYRSMSARLVDFNKDKKLDMLDLRKVQELMVSDNIPAEELGYFDLTNDSKMNNRDLKALQKLIQSHQVG